MSEPAKVRLVRCPKCQNLLPELNNYSVYECGGCGAVLRASKMNGDLDTFSVKSDEERVGGVSERLENFDFSGKRLMNLSDGSENDVKSNASSSSRTERRRVLQDRAENRTKMKHKADKWLVEEDTKVDNNIDELSHVEKEFEDLKLQSGDENGLRRSGKYPDRSIRERIETEGFQRARQTDFERRRYMVSKYSEEGPLNYHSESSYNYGEPLDNRNKGNGYDGVDYIGGDRAELLRKLDDLKDQLRRSGELADEPKEKIPHHRKIVQHDPYSGSEDWLSDSSSGLNRPFMQFPVPDQHVPRPSYMNHYAESSARMNMYETGGHSFYPPAHTRTHVQGVGDPLRSQMLRRGPHQAPAPFQQQPSRGYFSGHYLHKDMVPVDSMESYPPNLNQHHLSCTCYYCHNKIQVPQPHTSIDFGGKRFPDVQMNPVFYHHENPGPFGPRNFDPRIANMPSFKSDNLQSHSRWPSDIDSEVGSFVPQHLPRMHPSNGGRRCRPMAGGAPFLTCYNCFELLQVPKKVLIKYSNLTKLRCGACSTIIVFGVSNKSLLVSVHEDVKESTGKANDNHIMMLKEGNSNAQSRVDGNSNAQSRANRASTTFSSEDYDHSAYDFQSMDRELVSHLTDHPVSAKSAEMESLRSTSSFTSEDEANLDSLAASRKNCNHAEMPLKGKSPPPLASSSLQNNFEYSNKYHRGNPSENGDASRCSKQETVMPNKTTSTQNSTKDVSEATEMEISSNEYGNTGTSIDSGEASREGNQLRANKAAESFFAGITKKSFRDSNKSNRKVDQEKANVTVNGHLIPDRLIKKAEKLAGPIQPGHYWYDFRAGFWGVMGGPCLGVIPPFIEEFNYPMLENCAGGNTSVLVNGRELQQKDLNLLASRGLPNERNRSYIIEISGRVLDEYTGEELESLGKLAPTIERAKRGFGMKAPKAAA